MKSAKEHYAVHLAPIYLWSVGGAEAAFVFGSSELAALNLPESPGDEVLDLGAGFGAHAVPLARRGARVTAVDASDNLLESLRNLAGGLSIRTVSADLVQFLCDSEMQYAAILCMGDTITHLGSIDDVQSLLGGARRALLPGGKFVIALRDYTMPLRNEQRFIPVRADETRILTCFLEYQEAHVAVHDILHEKDAEEWHTRVSAYHKLRLAPDELLESLRRCGFHAFREEGLRGMVQLVATWC